jgi:hypothetical protein
VVIPQVRVGISITHFFFWPGWSSSFLPTIFTVGSYICRLKEGVEQVGVGFSFCFSGLIMIVVFWELLYTVMIEWLVVHINNTYTCGWALLLLILSVIEVGWLWL